MESRQAGEQSLLERGIHILRGLLGADWEVCVLPGHPGSANDAIIQLKAAGEQGQAQLLADTMAALTPSAVNERLAPWAALTRRLRPDLQPLVITETLTARAKDELRKNDINYVDLLGNVRLRLSRPLTLIHTDSQQRTPPAMPATPSRPKLAGPRAGRLVRLLADVAPPYQASELAAVARISRPYVSKLLDALEDQLLIRRQGRRVTEVDWPSLLRARAERLSLLRHNPHVGMVAPNGHGDVLERMRALSGEQVTLTGSYAAQQVAPVAVGGQMTLYVPHTPSAPYEIGERLGLLPAEHGADTLMLRAYDQVVFERAPVVEGVRQVALSQLVLDCLSGPGRMPAEGEAVLAHMVANESEWRMRRLTT